LRIRKYSIEVNVVEYVIEAKNVCKSFDGAAVLTDVSLRIPKGKVVGIIGANGSGKSVLFKLLCGFLKPDSGDVFVRGERIGEKFDFPSDVGVLINEPGYIEVFSGFKNLRFLAQINSKIGDEDIKDAMRLVRLDPGSKKKTKDYSMGMKQKLGVAQAIMENQDIVILDEPFNGLDFETANDIRQTIIKLKGSGKTVVMTSHTHSDIETLCDEVYILIDHHLYTLSDELKAKYFSKE
jgi:ABC-2 type transport system ATP-binding protein